MVSFYLQFVLKSPTRFYLYHFLVLAFLFQQSVHNISCVSQLCKYITLWYSDLWLTFLSIFPHTFSILENQLFYVCSVLLILFPMIDPFPLCYQSFSFFPQISFIFDFIIIIIELTHSKTILEITVEIEPQPAALDFKNLSELVLFLL